MKTLLILALILAVVPVGAVTMPECAGVVRVFGDGASWMTSAFVVGDGSWVVTTCDAVTEKIAPGVSQPVRTAVFISAYTGEAVQCEVKAKNTDLNLALLKLPSSGLPSVRIAKPADVGKAAFGTMGQLMSGEPVGNLWPTQIYGVTREKSGDAYRIAVGKWTANKVFVTDIGDFKWMFLSEMSEKNAPAGSIVAREEIVVGMYLSRLLFTGLGADVAYGRCAMAGEIVAFLGKNGVESAALYNPPSPTVKADETSPRAFQLQASIYTLIGAGRADAAVDAAAELVKLRPKDAQAQAAYGIALTGAGKFEDALKALDEAAKLDLKLPTLRLDRATALAGLRKNAEAEAELAKAVEESPSDVRVITAITDFYLVDEKTASKALTYASKAVTLAPKSPAALLLRARAEKRVKSYDDAVKTIESVLKFTPNWPPAYFALGATHEESGDKASAEKAYRKLVELQPKSPDALLTLASYLADNDKPADVPDLLTRLRDLNAPKEVLDAAKAIEDKIKPPAAGPPAAEK